MSRLEETEKVIKFCNRESETPAVVANAFYLAEIARSLAVIADALTDKGKTSETKGD